MKKRVGLTIFWCSLIILIIALTVFIARGHRTLLEKNNVEVNSSILDDTVIDITEVITTIAETTIETTIETTDIIEEITTVVETAAPKRTVTISTTHKETTSSPPETTEKVIETTIEESTQKTIPETTVSETTTTTDNGYRYIGNMKVTGYTHEEGFRYGQITASGIGCQEGICALNNTRRKELGIKYGDYIYIKGLGTYQVQDCGCSYNTVDVWFWTNKEAYAITGYYDVYIVN